MRSLTPTSTGAAIAILATLTTSTSAEENFPYTKPAIRFKPYQKLSTTAQTIAEEDLSYTPLTWNVVGLASVEKKRWSQLFSSEQEAAEQLGLNADLWDCFINHYEQYTWEELKGKEVQQHYTDLGWTQGHWEGTTDSIVYTESRWWGMLTDNEKKAANSLCYFEDNWDKIDMTPNPSFFPHPMPAFRYTPWAELDLVTQNVASGLMNYTQELWDNLGTNVVEKNTFLNLDSTARKGAMELGFYTHTWDCFMNHYLSYYWSSFHEDLKVAIETLGWTEEMWSDESDTYPTSEGTNWVDLTPEEKAAATRLCYFQESWDGEDLTSFYDYEGGKSDAEVEDGPVPKDINLDIFDDTGYVGKAPGSVGTNEYTSAESENAASFVSSNVFVLVLTIGAYLFV